MSEITVGGDINAHNVVGQDQHNHIVNHYYAETGRQAVDEAQRRDLARQIDAYLKWLRDRCKDIELRGIERAGGSPVVLLPLDTAYVPLTAALQREKPSQKVHKRRKDAADAEKSAMLADSSEIGPKIGADFGAEMQDISLNEVCTLSQRLVIIGGPGSGKTTVLLHIAWALASALLDANSTIANERLGLSGNLPLPMFVPLERFAHYRRHLPVNAPAEDRTLRKYIATYLTSKDAGFGLPSDFFARLIEQGQDVILLLDGLDEVANEDERAEVREAVDNLVRGKETLRTVVTCRINAYRRGRTALAADFREIRVRSLDFEQHITPMVRQAYACIYSNAADEAKQRSDDLLRGIQGLEAQRRQRLGDDAERLVDSPLMVRMLIIVHFNERTLPDERSSLFKKVVDTLLQVDYGPDVESSKALATNWEKYREMAQYLAWQMHQQGESQGREIDEAALKKLLAADAEFKPYCDDFLAQTRNRGGLMEERDGQYRFIHLAFQEFLVARYLREEIDGVEAVLNELNAARLNDSWWREPILLLVGYWGSNAPRIARTLLQRLANTAGPAPLQLLASELAATAALEWRNSGEATQQAIAQRIVTLYEDRAIHQNSSAAERARAGVALAKLGDPRPHIHTVDAMPLCVVPAGTFVMGSGKQDADAYDNEKPQVARFRIDYAYAIGQYAVSQAQYASFVAEGGYANAAWWGSAIADGVWVNEVLTRQVLEYKNDKWVLTPEIALQPFRFGDPFDLPNHPVVGVCWYEALAFCEWLTARWRAKGWLSTNQQVTLPNEPEWEKAARGGAKLPQTPLLVTAQRLTDLLKQPSLMQDNPNPKRRYAYGHSPDTDVPNPNAMNFDESKISATSALGAFLLGASPYGAHDLCGNVWEWTRSAWGKWELVAGDYRDNNDFAYPYLTEDNREQRTLGSHIARVVRGGSWFNDLSFARVAFRFWFPPAFRFNDQGFRVVVVSAPV